MEKYGVSNEELKSELQAKFAELTEKQKLELVKTGSESESIVAEMAAVKAKLDALEQSDK